MCGMMETDRWQSRCRRARGWGAWRINMRRSVGASVLVAGICLLLSGEAWGSPINVTYWRLASYASDTASGTGATEADEIVRFPMNEALTAEAGASKATVQHSFQATDTQVDLYSEFQEQRGGVRLSPWEYDGTGNTIYVRFTAPQDARFRINGEGPIGRPQRWKHVCGDLPG